MKNYLTFSNKTKMEDSEEIEKSLKEKMQKSVEALERSLLKIRTGRANPNMLENIRIDYYGTMTPILQVAHVAVPEPQMITISPWEKNMLGPIEKALQKSDLGITPQNDGNIIRLPIPPLNQERREELAKMARKNGEEFKVAIRNFRREGITQLKKMEADKLMSQDELKRDMDDVQKITDEFIAQITEIVEKKEAQLLED